MKTQKYRISDNRQLEMTLEENDFGWWPSSCVGCREKQCGMRCAAFEYNPINNSVTFHCCNRVIKLEVEK